MVHPRTGWKYYPSTSSSASAHWQHDGWKPNQSWDFGDLQQPGLNSKKLCRNPTSTGEPVAERTSTAFFLVQVVVFRLPKTFNSLAIDGRVNRYNSHTAHFSMYRCAQSVRTSHMM